MTIRKLLKPVYNRVLRHRLPRKWTVCGDVPARYVRLLDQRDYMPDYKAGLRSAIEDHVEADDTAVVVGLGRGVSSVWTARVCGDVIAYEAATEMLPVARETLEVQDLLSSVDIRHAVVGEAVDVFGSATSTVVSPSDLPAHDVLLMDCEGAETAILDELSERPETIIVETHPEKSAPTTATQRRLEQLDYAVTEYEYEPEANRKHVLVGTR